jgi:hypothetical protein
MDPTVAFPLFPNPMFTAFFSSRYDSMPTKQVFNLLVIELRTFFQSRGWKILLKSYQLEKDVQGQTGGIVSLMPPVHTLLFHNLLRLI